MGKLQDQIEQTLPPGMTIPDPIKLLFSWIEENGLYSDWGDGRRVGYLYKSDWWEDQSDQTERPGGTDIEFFAEDKSHLKHWFGLESPHDLNRLCVFAKTGGDGSMAAFWLNPQGQQRIVHIGSGSGSAMVCVLAEDAVDFLRLLAIGYDEICWDVDFSEPPNSGSDCDEIVLPNVAFQEWVRETFKVDIPRTALEIVKHPANMGDEDSSDEFWRWVNEHGSE